MKFSEFKGLINRIGSIPDVDEFEIFMEHDDCQYNPKDLIVEINENIIRVKCD